MNLSGLTLPIIIMIYSLIIVLIHVTMATRKLIIDTDGGPDDIMAIIAAVEIPVDTEIVAITTSCGNANATQSAINVMKALKVLGKMRIPVYQGCESFYMSSKDLQSDYFGEDSFGDFEFDNPPGPELIQKEHGVMAMIRLAKKFEGQLSIVCLGPVTNVAHAIKLYPKFLKNLQRIIVMGGSFKGYGNGSPGTEFNFRRDPEAAKIVIEHSTHENPVFIFPTDLCEEAKITKNWRINYLGEIKSPLMDFMNKAEEKVLSKSTSTFWHPVDSMAASVLLQPDIIMKITNQKVLVVNEGPISNGITLIDKFAEDKDKTVVVIEQINVEWYIKILVEAFKNIPVFQDK